MNYTTTFAVDISKSVFQVAISRREGHVSEHRRLSRSGFQSFFAKRQPATILLEACSSAHHWARSLESLGHRVVLLPPHAVRPYRTRNKTDRADAKALLEAFRNQDIHPVPIKSLDQHAIATLHRFRSNYLAQRTARINSTRGVLREIGIFIPTGARHLVPSVQTLIENPLSPIPPAIRPRLLNMCNEIRSLEATIRDIERELELLAKHDPTVTRLRTIPGIGLLSATALVASVGNIQRFPSGRHFASYLGLTPREHSSGLKRMLGSISKQGDPYLRMLLIHGARSVLWASKKLEHPDPLRTWALKIEKERGHNKAAVALANKLARIAWAVWKSGLPFKARKEVL